MERGAHGFQLCDVYIYCSGGLQQNEGRSVIKSLHISESHSSVHRLLGLISPQYFFFLHDGPFALTSVAFHFSVFLEPVINYHVPLEAAQSQTRCVCTCFSISSHCNLIWISWRILF